MDKRSLSLAEIQKLETAMLYEIDRICEENGLKYSLICGSVLGAIRHKGPIPWDSDSDITVMFADYERLCDLLEENLPPHFVLNKPGFPKDYYRYFARVGLNGVDSKTLHIDIFPQVGLPDDKEEQKKYSKKSDKLNQRYLIKCIRMNERLYKSRNAFRDFAGQTVKLMKKILLLPFGRKYLFNKMTEHYKKYDSKTSKFVMNPAGHYGMKNVLEREYFENTVRVEYDGIMLNIPQQYDKYLEHYYGDYMTPPPEDKRRDDHFPVYANSDTDIESFFIK